jgi:hypothetical protein
MPIRFRCPECGEKVALSEHLAGLHSHCPHCKSPILVPQPGQASLEQVTTSARPPAPPRPEPPAPVSEKLTSAPPPPVPDRPAPAAPPSGLSGMPRYQDTEAPAGFFPPDRDAPRPLAASGAGWGPVRAGLTVLQVSVGLFAAAVTVLVLLVVGFCMAGTGGLRLEAGLPASGALAAVGGGLIVGGLLLLGFLVYLVGQGICCAVPGQSGLKGLIITALVCSLASQVFCFVGGIAEASSRNADGDLQQPQREVWGEPPGRSRAPSAASLLVSVSWLVLFAVGHFLLAGFLRGVGRYFGDLGLVGQAEDYIKNLGTFLAIMIGLFAVSCVPVLALLSIALPFVFVVFVVILFIKLFNLLAATRATVATALVQG